MPRSLFFLGLLLLLTGCATPRSGGGGDDDDSVGDDDDAAGDDDDSVGDFQLSSGTYEVAGALFDENLCGQDPMFFFPEELTLDVDGSDVTISEWGIVADFDGESLEFETSYQLNYVPEGLACVLDVEATFHAELVGDDELDATFDVYMDEAPLEPNEECALIAELDFGFSSWNSITGCRAEGSWSMSR